MNLIYRQGEGLAERALIFSRGLQNTLPDSQVLGGGAGSLPALEKKLQSFQHWSGTLSAGMRKHCSQLSF